MQGELVGLHEAKLVEGPSGPRDDVPGKLGVFSYEGAGDPGELCLFVPNDPVQLDGRVKLRPGPGSAKLDSGFLRFTIKNANRSYAFQLEGNVTDPTDIDAFLAFAVSNDRIIRHLIEGAKLMD